MVGCGLFCILRAPINRFSDRRLFIRPAGSPMNNSVSGSELVSLIDYGGAGPSDI